MVSESNHATGLQAATAFEGGQMSSFNPTSNWTVEVAFPLRAGKDHGGLLDGISSAFDPTRTSAKTYSWVDIARAEHPRRYSQKGGRGQNTDAAYCPLLNCSEIAARPGQWEADKENPSAAECGMLAKANPTLLGSDPFYGCYWEWVLQNVGSSRYMHRPTEFAILEFVPPDGAHGAAHA